MTFKRPPPRPAKQIGEGYTLRARPVSVSSCEARMSVPVPKVIPLDHKGYMAAVRKLPCYRCGVVGFTQFCHRDEGKGMGTKTDCREGWPGCGPHHGEPGCHWLIGTSGRFLRCERRGFELEAGIATRATIHNAGLWPANLPAWAGDEVQHGMA